MSAPTIDRATFDALTETTGAEFVFELLDTFLEEAPSMLDELRQALATGDAAKFRRAAHSLKSNCNTFGALTMGAMARELEQAHVSRIADDGAQPLSALTDEYARVAAALKELRHG
jgi:HPt (histidine-containing phosphotransfer) domain-containing protein